MAAAVAKIRLSTWLSLLIALCLIVGVAVVFYDDGSDQSQEMIQTEVVPQPEPVLESAQSRLFIAGDIMWGRRNQVLAEANGGPQYLFDGFQTFGRDNYDTWIGNVECPITDTEVPMAEQEDLLRFNCQPQYLEQFGQWFDIASLANNHTDNVGGEAGLIETRQQLDSAGLQYFGHYDNAVLSDVCEIVAVDVRVTNSDGGVTEERLPIALCGYHGVFKLMTDEELAILKTVSDTLPTIVMPHMGAEYEPTSDSLREQQYRAMIDNGADVVVGGHPHWVQNTEVYNDKLIVYSLGNFLFDQAWSVEVQQGIALDMTMDLTYDDNLAAWLSLGESCTSFQDACLLKARDQGLQKVDADLTYDVIATQYKEGQTTRGSDRLQEVMYERTNWPETLEQLSQ